MLGFVKLLVCIAEVVALLRLIVSGIERDKSKMFMDGFSLCIYYLVTVFCF